MNKYNEFSDRYILELLISFVQSTLSTDNKYNQQLVGQFIFFWIIYLKLSGIAKTDYKFSECRGKIIKMEDKIDKLTGELNSLEKKIKELESLKETGNKEIDRKNIQKKAKKNTYIEELEKHAENFDRLKLVLTAGSDCCEVEGVIFNTYSNYLKILNSNNNTINIPYNKIALFKKVKYRQQKNSQKQLPVERKKLTILA